MNARRLASLSLLLVVACGGQKAEEAPPAPAPQAAEPAPPADAWRRERPKADPVPELHAPVPVQKVLTNGLTVLSVPKPALPIVNVSLIIKSGSAQDPAGQEGVAGFTADMLKNGTAKLTAEAIADEVETRGSSIDVDVDEDSITLSATALKENIGAVFDVMADLVQHAAFQPKEIERARKQRQASLAQSQDDPARTANRVFRSVVYGGHPYGHTTLGTTKALKKLGKKELQAYFAAHFRPANAAVVVVGDWTVDEAQKEVDKRLGAWKGKPAVQAPPAAPQAQPAELALVARSGAPQSQLMVGHLAVSRADPDYFSLVICNAILGGLFNSRINMNLREAKGYTYGARSYFDFMREQGPFFVSTGVRTDATEDSIKEILKEMDKIRTADVTPEELDNAKSRYSLSLPGYFQTVDGVAGMMANLFLFDLPLDYYQKLPEHIEAVTAADVRRVADKHLHTDNLTIVVVGDKNHVEPALGDLQRGPVRQRDAEGNLLTAAK